MNEFTYTQKCRKQKKRIYLNAFNTQKFTQRNIPLVLISCFSLIFMVSALDRCDEPKEYAVVILAVVLIIAAATRICLRWLQDFTKYVMPDSSRLVLGEKNIRYFTDITQADGMLRKRAAVFDYEKMRDITIDKSHHSLRFFGDTVFIENGEVMRTAENSVVVVTYAFMNREEEKDCFDRIAEIRKSIREMQKAREENSQDNNE